MIFALERPEGQPSRLAFENEETLLEFYLSTLRINVQLEPERRVQFVLRDPAPDFEDPVRQATQALAGEYAGS